MENVLQTLDPKLCIICGKHFEKGKKKDPYAQNPTVEGLQRILTLAQQRDDDVHKLWLHIQMTYFPPNQSFISCIM